MRTILTNRQLRPATWACLLATIFSGCVHPLRQPKSRQHAAVPQLACEEGICDAACDLYAMEIEYPDVERCGLTADTTSLPPREMSDGIPEEFWEMTIEEAIQIALNNGRVLKDLGARVLSAPQSVTTVFDPSIQFSHPRLGEAAALAAFDAQWAQAFTYRDGTQVFNNRTLGGGAARVNQDIFRAETQLAKTAATGAQFQIRSFLEHDHNDIGIPPNLFSHAWTAGIEASVRQPLLRGSGVAFNRIAGPQSSVDLSLTPGVVVARINSDITLADFERGVRDFINEVESAYWQLYLAYQVMDANRIARDSARKTWQAVEARFDAGMEGGAADQEAQAREQVFFFEQQVLTSLNGAGAGTPGVYEAERQLRRLLGLPVNDGALIRPANEPTDACVVFNWDECVADALVRRVELRQQMWRVKQRELEVLAAKNFLLPQLDAVAAFRSTGLGDDLVGGGGPSALSDLWNFNNDQVEAGLQLNIPIGFRRELAGLRHSQLNLCRERAILHDQEHAITHSLADALVELKTAHELIGLTLSRMAAAEDALSSQTAVFEAGRLQINFLLEAQRRLTEARIAYFRSRVQHSLALLSVHREKGTLLGYNGIMLQEGNWCELACRSHDQYRRRFKHTLMDYRCRIPGRISLGPVPHAIDEPAADKGGDPPVLSQPLLPRDLIIDPDAPSDSLDDPHDTDLLPPLNAEPLPDFDLSPEIDEESELPDLPSRMPAPDERFFDEASESTNAPADQLIPSSEAPVENSRKFELTQWLEPVGQPAEAGEGNADDTGESNSGGCYPQQAAGCYPE